METRQLEVAATFQGEMRPHPPPHFSPEVRTDSIFSRYLEPKLLKHHISLIHIFPLFRFPMRRHSDTEDCFVKLLVCHEGRFYFVFFVAYLSYLCEICRFVDGRGWSVSEV